MKDLRSIEYEGKRYIDNYVRNGYNEYLTVKIGFYEFGFCAEFKPITETVETEREGFFGSKYKDSYEKLIGYKLRSIYFTCSFDYDYWKSLSAEEKLPLLKDFHQMIIHMGQMPYAVLIKDNKFVFSKWDIYDFPYKEEIKQIITDFWQIF